MLKPKSDISILLKEKLESYYWAGFIMADGTITDNTRIRISIHQKDSAHLLKFAKYIKCNNVQYIDLLSDYGLSKQIRIQARDRIFVPKFAEKFDIKKNKTYEPPNLNWLRGNKFLAFFAGFVDGDGCIDIHVTKPRYSQTRLRILAHKTWFNLLHKFETKLYTTLHILSFKNRIHTHIDNRGFARLDLMDSTLLVALKKELQKMNLPLMKRKWDKIKINKEIR